MLGHRYCWKAVMESIRKLEKVSGYQWWLLVDCKMVILSRFACCQR